MRGDQELVKQLINDARGQVYYDRSDFLREKVWDDQNIFQIIDEIDAIIIEDEEERYHNYIALAYLYRLVNYPQQSSEYYKWCLEYLETLYKEEDVQLLTVYIRYSETLRYLDVNEALELLNLVEALANKNQHQEILDFIYQQQAKCLLELNQLEEAAIKFEAALKIRENKKDKRLIKATKLHLKFISELKSNNHQ